VGKIHPYRGVHYNKEKIRDLSLVVTQPYDKITPEMQEEYYRKSPYNIVRLILGKKEASDNERNNQYTRAREYLRQWMKEGILVRDETPALYASYQEYEAGKKKYIRKGFVALLELEETGAGVKAHEKTLAGPKADRLNLMRATESHFEHIFMLYSDPEQKSINILDRATAGRDPDYEAVDEYGARHMLWTIRDPKIIEELKHIVESKTLFIADGHHRYETSVNYMREMLPYLDQFEQPEAPNNRQLTLVPMEQEGLIILPTHRVIHSVKGFDLDRLIGDFSEFCTVEEFPVEERDKLPLRLNERITRHAFGLVAKGAKSCYIFTLKSDNLIESLVGGEHSKAWKSLDVTILHALLEKFLGIDAKALEAYTNVKYVREPEEGYEMLEKEANVQAVFLLNPTKINEVKEVALAGERMPQKSTDFYPKLITGLVMNVMRRKSQ
jgi:uncharacterized protein (DUF1015 family)